MASRSALRGSPRFLTLQHSQNVRTENARSNGVGTLDLPPAPPAGVKPPDRGYEQLYSYFSPALAGGKYSVTAKQTVSGNDKDLKPDPTTTKDFTVDSPQYFLPDGAVHSVFPPPGSEAHAEVLPHILFTDPYLPWERLTENKGNDRERMPWLALVAFTEDELTLGADVLDAGNGLLKDTDLAKKSTGSILQTPTLALNMAVSDIPRNLTKLKTRIPTIPDNPPPSAKDARGDVILVKPTLFELLTANYSVDGKQDTTQTAASIGRYRYLAHVRYSSAEGMEATGDDGLYAVVFSHRAGPLRSDKSSRTIVHLLSLENWLDWKRSETSAADYIMLSSLYSWSYTTLSTGALNVSETFLAIGKGRDLLRVPAERLKGIGSSPQAQRVKQRLEDGYTLTKYITQTGEETAAIVRGPLIPSKPPEKFGEDWSSLSFSGANLQIFDAQAGLMDITYSTAWNLGKTLALSDQAFTTSLARLRTICDASALNTAKTVKLTAHNAWTSRNKTVSSLPEAVEHLSRIAHGTANGDQPRSVTSFSDTSGEGAIDLSRNDPTISEKYEEATTSRVSYLAGSNDHLGSAFFNELNKPNSADWMVVMTWIIDKMFLFNIPSQYLLPDPSCLPDETLRFFYIDPYWRDAFIDGALSLANHLKRTDDSLRRNIKSTLMDYFKTVDPSTGYAPQYPTYGFLMRSDLVTVFPDLHVTAPIPVPANAPEKGPHKRAPVLRNEKLSQDTLLCLFDRVPGSSELPVISFTQPAHQQYFVAGDTLTEKEFKYNYKNVHSIKPQDEEHAYSGYAHKTLDKKEDPQKPEKYRTFVWGEENNARFLNMTAFTDELISTLTSDVNKTYTDNMATSALIGYQLGSSIYQMNLLSDNLTVGVSTLSVLSTAPEIDEAPLFRMLQPLAETGPDLGPNTAKFAESRPVVTALLKEVENVKRTAIPSLALRTSAAPLAMTATATATATASGDSTEENSGDEGSDRPDFALDAYPIDNFEGSVPTDKDYPVDLVFKIVAKNADQFDTEGMKEISLEIPYGTKDSKKCLLESYSGPGPVMVNNLRWNVVMTYRKQASVLRITLTPRSTKGVVLVRRARDCSFILPMVWVNKYAKETYIKIRHTEKYTWIPDQSDSFDVVLRPTPKPDKP